LGTGGIGGGGIGDGFGAGNGADAELLAMERNVTYHKAIYAT